MKRRATVTAIVCLCVSPLATPSYADAPPRVCTWVRTEPVAGPWWTIQGGCKVTITEGYIEAVLYDEKSPAWVRMRLSGSVQGSKVAVKVDVEGTDSGLEDFTGDLTKQGPLGTVIVLRSGPNIIGIKYGAN